MQAVTELRDLLHLRGFRRLFAVRIASQAGDGVLQAGLATVFFFSPERMATAGGVAAAFAVLLLPFTVVGPFAGPLLDRWSRRQVLVIGNTVRLALVVGIAVVVATAGFGPPVYVLALVTLGVNRFLLAALSAGLPKVVPADRLVVANSLTPTLGAVSAVAGFAVGLLAGAVLPAGALREALVVGAAGAAYGCAAALALRLHRDELGPDRGAGAQATGSRGIVGEPAAAEHELIDGARYLLARRTPAAALAVMAGHRFLYGVNFLALLLISHNLLADPTDAGAGLARFATIAGLSFVGNGIAVVVTPVVRARIAPQRWVVVCLGIGAAGQLVLLIGPAVALVAGAAVAMGFAVQGAKIAVDTVVQRDTADRYRGRAFALYDMVYNAAFVCAAALAAVLLPDTGWSRGAFAVLATAFGGLACAYGRIGTHAAGDGPSDVTSVAPARPGTTSPAPVPPRAPARPAPVPRHGSR